MYLLLKSSLRDLYRQVYVTYLSNVREEFSVMSQSKYRQQDIRAPRGTTLTAKSWLTEAPLRMLMNNLIPMWRKIRMSWWSTADWPRRAQLGML
jgi:hypothetical protein